MNKCTSISLLSLVAVVAATVVSSGAFAAGPAPSPSKAGADARLTTTKSGLKYADLEPGTGAAVKPGMLVLVDYEGWLANGEKFDSSYDRREPFRFKVGAGDVILGWEEGVVGMKVGGKRKLIVPADLAYGEAGAPPRIPANATLTFEIRLLAAQ